MFDVTMFMTPERRKQFLKQEQDNLEAHLKNAIEWDEDKTKFANWLFLKGASFEAQAKRYQVFDTEPVTAWPRRGADISKEPGFCWSPSKKYVYANRTLRRASRLEIAQNTRRGYAVLDSDVTIPILCEYKPGHWEHELQPWMSFTPMEVLTQRQGIRLATKKVLVGGLGLGWQLRKIAEKKSVKEIVVVEIDQELIDWYGEQLVYNISNDTGKPITLICDDVVNQIGKHGDETRHILDIWKSYNTWLCDLKPELREALRGVKYWWGWGVLAEPSRY